MPAVWYPDPYGTIGFCRLHDLPEKRAMDQADAYAQIARIIEQQAEYRRDLYPAVTDLHRLLLERIAENPEWTRAEDESRSEYLARIRGIIARYPFGRALAERMEVEA